MDSQFAIQRGILQLVQTSKETSQLQQGPAEDLLPYCPGKLDKN